MSLLLESFCYNQDMGSGRGNARRVQSVASAMVDRNFLVESSELEKWLEFVDANGLQNVKLQQYYLGSVSSDLTDADYGKILTGLFHDALAVGAITLSARCKAEDFRFEKGFDAFGVSVVQISLKGNPDDTAVLQLNVERYLRKQMTMGRPLGGTVFVLRRIVEGINYLI
jgi:hypothetical protein